MKLKGTVKSIEKYGVFINITNAVGRLSGLAHISECTEDATRKTDLSKLYSVGDDVKAVVMKVHSPLLIGNST
jgi:ribosomal protein S1